MDPKSNRQLVGKTMIIKVRVPMILGPNDGSLSGSEDQARDSSNGGFASAAINPTFGMLV
jgi:hypothetical protein